ncbi:VPLPA-CTERM sorting domain-containing protein [Tropicimonas sp. TH_r6]|uniref:VPLPA-CTERM sorting domain-containing protein n=1 Tax=Tropicimonas sp. TH_r6 TaxID=3082085 RepID=UPI002954D551|nr:VPLPA-CTERM sorting domain-containing protein [Tropicimonas sp. TH_r6]MDV7144975.1 VPLPA-CTERM sorting domain-containing protein [Tropicimonas sp. TH_r6]
MHDKQEVLVFMFSGIRFAAFATATVLSISLADQASSSPFIPESPLPTGEFTLEKQGSSYFTGVGSSSVRIIGNNVKGGALNVAAGGFAVKTTDGGSTNSFIAWCLDTFQYLDLGVKYEVTDTPFAGAHDPKINAAQQTLITKLFDTAFDTLVSKLRDNVASAAFQLALWEIVNETGDTLDVMSGAFHATVVGGNVLTDANSLLDGLAASADRKYNLVFLEAKGKGQDLLTVVPIPVPASSLLLLGALGGLGTLASRRRRRHA